MWQIDAQSYGMGERKAGYTRHEVMWCLLLVTLMRTKGLDLWARWMSGFALPVDVLQKLPAEMR